MGGSDVVMYTGDSDNRREATEEEIQMWSVLISLMPEENKG
jgi:cation transport ATPase